MKGERKRGEEGGRKGERRRERGKETQASVASVHLEHPSDSSHCAFHLPKARNKCRASAWYLCLSMFYQLHPAGCRHRRSSVHVEQIFVRMRTLLAAQLLAAFFPASHTDSLQKERLWLSRVVYLWFPVCFIHFSLCHCTETAIM